MPRGSKASVVIDKSSSDAANMKALSRTDNGVVRILHKVPHGAVYVFDVDAGTWKKSEVEGSLFLVERRSSPMYRVIVMNKLSRTNLLLDMVPGMQAELKGQLVILTFPQHTGTPVHGLWSAEAAEGEGLVGHISALAEGSLTAPAEADTGPAHPHDTPASVSPSGKAGRSSGKKSADLGPSPSPPAATAAAASGGPVAAAEAAPGADSGPAPASGAGRAGGAAVRAAVADAVASSASSAAVDRGALKEAILQVLSQDSFVDQVATAYERAVAARSAAAASDSHTASAVAGTASPGGRGRKHGRGHNKRNGKQATRS